MAKTEIRLSREDSDKDGFPEILVELYEDGQFIQMAYAASSTKSAAYDKLSMAFDADGDNNVGDIDKGNWVSDPDDKALILALVNAYAKFKI